MEKIKCMLAMYPTVSLYNEEAVEEFLNIFERDEKLFPERWGNAERIKIKYEKEECKNFLLDESHSMCDISLYRNKNVKYSGYSSIDNAKSGYLNFSFEYSENELERFFELADSIVKVLKPIFCTAGIQNQQIIVESEYEKKMYAQMIDS